MISVIIPTYNRPTELKRAINSVLNQTYQDFEILIIDDFSEIDLTPVINDFSDTRIKYHRLEKKGNANVARNLGVRNANGDYIAFLDSDDEYFSNHLQRRIEKIKEWKCDGIYGSAKVKMGNDESITLTRQIKQYETPLNFLLSGGFAPTPSLFFTKDSAIKIQWNETLERHQDYDFLMRYFQHFNLQADYEPTIYIHWEEIRTVNFKSSFSFIKKHSKKINPYIYVKHLIFMRGYALKKTETKKYALLYETEIFKYIKYIDLHTFLSMYKNKNTLKIQKLKLVYFYNVFFKKSKKIKLNNTRKIPVEAKQVYSKQIQEITNTNFSIISANCWSGSVYENLKLQYQTPTIGLFFYAPCYIEFLKNLKHYLNCELKFTETSKYEDANKYRNEEFAYPIGILDNKVEIQFLHYTSNEQATSNWNRRKARIDFDNLYIAMTDRDLCTYELMQEFDKLSYKKKVIFTAKKYPEIKSSVYLSAYKKDTEVGDLYNQRENVTLDFDIKNWLGNEK